MRSPAVAGAFYHSVASQLRSEVKGCIVAGGQVKPRRRLAIVSPHAGYRYSGKTAGHSFAACSNWSGKELTAIIIGPNHTGLGTPVSVSFEDWSTPLGEVGFDRELAEAILASSKISRRDELAHIREHSVEVQLPFLQVACPHAKFVGICMGLQDAMAAGDLGAAMFEAVKKTGRNAIVIASSDFTHYESAKDAKKRDMMAIERILALDYEGFEAIVDENDLSICGHGPIAAAAKYSVLAGASKCELFDYTTSGEVTGDYENVVAYASLAFSKE